MMRIEREFDRIRREERQAQQRRIAEAYARVPALADIERERQAAFAEAAARRLSPDAARERLSALSCREQRLLAENGFAPDALELHYRCPACRDTGYLGSGLRRPCACRLKLRALLDPSVQINNHETFEAFDPAVYPAEAQRKQALAAKRFCEGYVASLPDPEKPNLLFMGMAGLGKSYLGNAIAYRALERGIDAARTTAYAFVQDMLSGIRGDGSHAARYRRAPLLVLDDLGTEPVIPNVSEESLFAVLNERIGQRLPTVLATNLDFPALQQRYGERVFSRLTDSATTCVIRLEGENLRWRRPPC